jgi:hypothetical protein
MLREWATSFRSRENAVKKISRILAVLLSEVIALSCIWPGLTATAQQVSPPLDKNDPEIRAGSVVYMKETPLKPFGDNVFHVDGGSFYGNFITFETGNDGSMRLKWRNYTFNKRR